MRDHWEARCVAPHVMLARGWERQLDSGRNTVFYDTSTPLERLALARYRAWLVRSRSPTSRCPTRTLDYRRGPRPP